MWFDASNGVVGGGQAAGDAEPMDTWVNLVGNGLNLVQMSGSKMPMYYQNEVKGKHPAVVFDGVDDFLWTPVSALLNPNEVTVFIVHNNVAASGMFSTMSASDNCVEGFDLDAWVAYHMGNPGWTNKPHQAPPLGWVVESAIFGLEPTSIRLWFNGVESNQGLVTYLTQSNFAMVPRLAYLGSRATFWGFWPGSVAEALVFGRVLTLAERAGVETYLRAKYSI